ncbi:MAG TPA: hypothetical protein VJS14_05985 [Enterobacteriaceae bacterium]|nr:hypothetical protein [Enterobacteriaceae bacterium]
MKTIATILLAALALSTAALASPMPQSKNMDDVQSLSVNYINHNTDCDKSRNAPASCTFRLPSLPARD